MTRRLVGLFGLSLALVLAGCGTDDHLLGPGGGGGGQAPAAPRALDAWYYAGQVHLSWELAPGWDDDTFRIYGKRAEDADYFLVAEVTNCMDAACSYTDVNVVSGRTYHYYVAAVDPESGLETATEQAVAVEVPEPVPPPVPGGAGVVALDGANYLHWSQDSRSADDFSHYRVYVVDQDGASFFVGETDSEGFLDLLAENGLTYTYYVSAVDTQGHESQGSDRATGTPRPDYHGEWLFAHGDRPSESGFRFTTSESDVPVLSGTDPARHFRLEVDGQGWWLVPGPEGRVYPQGWETTALKCGPAADQDCVDVTEAPRSGYGTDGVALLPQTTYVLRVTGDDGQTHYGAVRAVLLGFDQNDDALMIFDWSYQLQPDNRALSPGADAGAPSSGG